MRARTFALTEWSADLAAVGAASGVTSSFSMTSFGWCAMDGARMPKRRCSVEAASRKSSRRRLSASWSTGALPRFQVNAMAAIGQFEESSTGTATEQNSGVTWPSSQPYPSSRVFLIATAARVRSGPKR